MFLANGFRAGPSGDPGSDFWFSPMASPTQSGAVVTSDTAMRFSTVYKCVRVYAETVGSLPRRLMHHVDERKRERVRNHPVAKLLSVKPNRWQTPMQFTGMMEAHVQLRGRAYAEIFFDNRMQPDELVPLHPDRVTTEVMMDGLPRWKVKPPKGRLGDERVLLPGEMLHLTGLSLDGYEGLSPIDQEREAIGSAIAARDFGSRFWNNDARPPFWIEVPGKFKDNEARADFRAEWQVAYGGSNRGRPAVLDRGMKIQELGLDNQTAQWLESREYADKDIAGIYRLPPHKIGILTDAKYANIEQQAIEFVTDSLLPRCVSWEEAIHRDLLNYDEELYVKFVVAALQRGDIKSRYESYSKGIQDGWLVRNEARDMEDLNPLPGLDEPLQQLNMGQGNRQNLPPQQPARGSRAEAMLGAAAGRVARKEAALVQQIAKGADAVEALGKHARFMAEALALPEHIAIGYCDHTRVRIEQLQSAGGLGAIVADDWIRESTAALVRLGE